MSRRRAALRSLALAGALLLLAAAWFLVDPIDGYPYFVGAGVGVALAALRRLARRADAPPRGLLPWLAPALAGSALTLFANAWLDRSPRREVPSHVLLAEEGGQQEGALVLRGFRPGEPELRVQRHSRVGMALSPGDDVTLVVRQGLFGWAWFERITSDHGF